MRFTKKIVTVIIVLVMVASIMPAVVFASTQSVANTFTFPFNFSATDLSGNQVTQDSLGQKEIFFVYFWTTTCWGCVEGLPDLTRLANEFGDRVGFLSVLGDFGVARERALEVTRNAGIPFITIDATHRDLNGLMSLLDSGFVPTSIIIGADGRVIGEQMVGGDFNTYSQAIRGALQQVSSSTPVSTQPFVPAQQQINTHTLSTLDIIRIMETPISGANNAQLTLATGTGVNEVWIRFDNPARYFRGTMVTENANMRIWEIDFQPISGNPHDVEVFANRAYIVQGATRQTFRITHNPSPFIRPVFDPLTNELLPIAKELYMPSSSFPFRFSTTDLQGNRVTEASLGERALFFVHITATWCGPCNFAAPAVAAISQEFGDRVGFITLLDDFNENVGRNRAIQWTRNYGGAYIVVDQHLSAFRPIINILDALPVREYDGQLFSWGYPTSIIVDGDGNLIDLAVGASVDFNYNVNNYRVLIENALAQVTQVVTTQVEMGNIVSLCQVPLFQNQRMGTYQTNGRVADTIRSHIERYAIFHTNHTAETFNTTAEMQRQSDALLQEILNVWDSDPATRIFGVNRAGMEARFRRVSMFPYTSNSNRIGFWREYRHEGWFSTHYIDANGMRVQRPIDDIVFTYLYELFGRGEGMGIHLSNTIAEHLMGVGSSGSPSSWCCRYTGFQHHLGERFGLHNVFANARQGQDHYRNWVNQQIRAMNSNFTFTYDELQRAKVGVGNVHRNASIESQFSRIVGVPDVRQHIADAWSLFYTATNQNLPATQRNNAARQFSEFVQQASQLVISQNLFLTWSYGAWNDDGVCICTGCNPCLCNDPCSGRLFSQVPSVHDDNRPMFNMSNQSVV